MRQISNPNGRQSLMNLKKYMNANAGRICKNSPLERGSETWFFGKVDQNRGFKYFMLEMDGEDQKEVKIGNNSARN
jgi:hypothetical protein